MKIRLKVLKGSNAGKELKLPLPKCLIGRGEDCHLRPKSEAISRRHCVIFVKEGNVFIRDLDSKNGTHVNGERIDKDVLLKPGDRVQAGPLAFEIVIDHALGGEKRSKVNTIREAAARTTEANRETTAVQEEDIGQWLEEADELERERRISDPETRQLRLDETDQVQLQKAMQQRAEERSAKDEDETKEMSSEEAGKKKVFGKLPPRPDKPTKDSREAAAAMLRKFFNNR